MPRPVNAYFYDERAPGDTTARGFGVRGCRPTTTRTPDLTGAAGSDQDRRHGHVRFGVALGQSTGGEQPLVGMLDVTAGGGYVFATAAEGGARLVIDGNLLDHLVDRADGGQHRSCSVVREPDQWETPDHARVPHHRGGGADPVALDCWGNGTCANATTAIPSSARSAGLAQPDLADHLRIDLEREARSVCRSTHFTPSDADGCPTIPRRTWTGQRLISTYTYDTYGRMTQRVLPKGNASKTISSTSPTQGDLSGGTVAGYTVSYDYYVGFGCRVNGDRAAVSQAGRSSVYRRASRRSGSPRRQRCTTR